MIAAFFPIAIAPVLGGVGWEIAMVAAVFPIVTAVVWGRRDCVADMMRTTRFANEQEILISCNAGFRVVAVDMNTNPRTIRLRLDDERRCPRDLARGKPGK